jgi:hypothetical protein
MADDDYESSGAQHLRDILVGLGRGARHGGAERGEQAKRDRDAGNGSSLQK